VSLALLSVIIYPGQLGLCDENPRHIQDGCLLLNAILPSDESGLMPLIAVRLEGGVGVPLIGNHWVDLDRLHLVLLTLTPLLYAA
jgi:hypothetical protein